VAEDAAAVDEAEPEEIEPEGDGEPEEDGEPGWFGVRCIFRWSDPPTYEERLTLWEADSLDQAIEKAEQEAVAYATQLRSEYLQIAQAYWIGPDRPGEGAELFSLLRDSELDADDYIDAFYDTGSERMRTTD
jgi:hypothetical protein